MTRITDADRHAAQELRVILADISGFWHVPGDEGPLCLALARHRQAAEARLADKLVPLFAVPGAEVTAERPARPARTARVAQVKLSA
jgi:hypothetical protein